MASFWTLTHSSVSLSVWLSCASHLLSACWTTGWDLQRNWWFPHSIIAHWAEVVLDSGAEFELHTSRGNAKGNVTWADFHFVLTYCVFEGFDFMHSLMLHVFQVVQDDFVQRRKVSLSSFSVDDFHSLLTLSRWVQEILFVFPHELTFVLPSCKGMNLEIYVLMRIRYYRFASSVQVQSLCLLDHVQSNVLICTANQMKTEWTLYGYHIYQVRIMYEKICFTSSRREGRQKKWSWQILWSWIFLWDRNMELSLFQSRM